jgi:HAD superfamily hydrolase (TIGR01509 family)
MPSAERLDAITVDAFGTLVELGEPYERLRAALAERGVEREREAVAKAFAAELAYYLPRAHAGHDLESLARLRRDCAAVFLDAAGVTLDPDEFAPAYVASLEFRPLPGSEPALERLQAAGLVLACVSNWDISLANQLAGVGLARYFSAVVSSAEAGAPKPDPRPFDLALAKVRVEPGRALHIGDSDADRDGAGAAGLAFEPVPLVTLPARLGL